MYLFEKKPKKSYSITNIDMKQLDFLVNEMMFIITQYNIVEKFDNEDDFILTKLRFHVVVRKEPEEIWSLVKIKKVIRITKDVMFENMIHNFSYHVVRVNIQVCDFSVADFL